MRTSDTQKLSRPSHKNADLSRKAPKPAPTRKTAYPGTKKLKGSSSTGHKYYTIPAPKPTATPAKTPYQKPRTSASNRHHPTP